MLWSGVCFEYRSSKLFYTCEGSRFKCCTTYTHAILPHVAQGRNFNSCCHVRRVGLLNPTLTEEMYTTQGLRLRFNEKGMTRLRKAYDGRALKLVFKDEMKCCDCVCKYTLCPCKCCSCVCCKELKVYELLIPGEAFIDGKDVSACCGVRGTSCCYGMGCLCLFWCCTCCCENQYRVHHTEYELVEHEGNFISPRPMDMERSEVRRPASPTRQSPASGFASVVTPLPPTIQ